MTAISAMPRTMFAGRYASKAASSQLPHAVMHALRWGHEHMRRDLVRKFHRAVVRGLISRHSDTMLAGHEYHLASGLYPGAPEFKHQNQITLYLLAYPLDHHADGDRGGDAGHRLTSLRGRCQHALSRVFRQLELEQAGDEVAVRADHRIVEQHEH